MPTNFILKCEDCNGTGEIRYGDYGGAEGTSHPCEYCEGTGVKWFSDYYPTWGDLLLDVPTAMTLKQCRNELGTEPNWPPENTTKGDFQIWKRN